MESTAGSWFNLGVRAHVFDGMPTALYLPIQTEFTLKRTVKSLFVTLVLKKSFQPGSLSPKKSRGGANATRQINHILKPEFAAQRLLLVEVYTPGGNWSSYPPHKHDVHSPPEEVDLEALYYYKVDAPEGYAIQRVYTADGRIDQTLTVRDGELVLIPEGYHPVVAAHGYNVYYLDIPGIHLSCQKYADLRAAFLKMNDMFRAVRTTPCVARTSDRSLTLATF